MFTEPSDIDRSEVLDALRAHWSIEATSIEHAPVGFGSHHYVVDERWFLTLDELDDHAWFDDALEGLKRAFETAWALREDGLVFVLAAIPATDGQIIHRTCGHYGLTVFPFERGRSSRYGEHASDDERREVLSALGQLHSAPPPASARRDPLAVLKRDGLDAALEDLDATWDAGPFAEPTRELLVEYASSVRERLAVFEQLAASLSRDDWVITHGEPHAANVLRTDDGRFLLIDWDTVAVGPRERDLWMVEPRDADDWAAYGSESSVDPDAIRLYRLWWGLTEIALYTTQFRRPHVEDADTRTAFDGFREYLTSD